MPKHWRHNSNVRGRRKAGRHSGRHAVRASPEVRPALTVPIERLAIGGATVYAINGRTMVFILEKFTLEMVEPLLGLKPREVVAIDGVFHDSDELKTNLDLQCRDAQVRFTCV